MLNWLHSSIARLLCDEEGLLVWHVTYMQNARLPWRVSFGQEPESIISAHTAVSAYIRFRCWLKIKQGANS